MLMRVERKNRKITTATISTRSDFVERQRSGKKVFISFPSRQIRPHWSQVEFKGRIFGRFSFFLLFCFLSIFSSITYRLSPPYCLLFLLYFRILKKNSFHISPHISFLLNSVLLVSYSLLLLFYYFFSPYLI